MLSKLFGPAHTFEEALIILEKGLRNGEIVLDNDLPSPSQVTDCCDSNWKLINSRHQRRRKDR